MTFSDQFYTAFVRNKPSNHLLLFIFKMAEKKFKKSFSCCNLLNFYPFLLCFLSESVKKFESKLIPEHSPKLFCSRQKIMMVFLSQQDVINSNTTPVMKVLFHARSVVLWVIPVLKRETQFSQGYQKAKLPLLTLYCSSMFRSVNGDRRRFYFKLLFTKW